MLVPIIGIGVLVGIALLKLSMSRGEASLAMTDERRRLLIRAGRDHQRMAEEGKEFS